MEAASISSDEQKYVWLLSKDLWQGTLKSDSRVQQERANGCKNS